MNLDDQILAAHAENDRAALVDLYAQAADQASDDDARAFFLTYAHVYALELGHPRQGALFTSLRGLGRE